MQQQETELKELQAQLKTSQEELQVKDKELNHFRTLYEDSYE